MAATAHDIFSRIASGIPIHPFDPINDPTLYIESKNTAFYSLPPDRRDEAVRRKLAQTRVMAYGAEMGARNIERYFCPTPMSSSLATYRQLLLKGEHPTVYMRGGWRTAQDPQDQLPKNDLIEKIVLPSHIASHWKGDLLERAFPSKGIMVVSDVEGPIRFMRTNQAASGGAHFHGTDYEHYWVPSVWRSHGTILFSDHSVSRHANAEEIAGDMIQCGFLDKWRSGLPPGREYAVVDEMNKPVPLSDRAWETAKHVFDKVEHGFKEDFALFNLISRLQIHEWLKDPEHSPLDMDKVHPDLKNRGREDVARMERLKKLILPYIADKCLEWFPYESEPFRKSYVETHILPHAGRHDPKNTVDLREQLFSYVPRGGNNTFLHAQYNTAFDVHGAGALASEFSATTRKVKRRGTDGMHFEDEAVMFDDKARLFAGLPVREQAAITLMAGALEATRAPEDRPGAWGYTCHPKGGERALKWMEKRGIDYLREAQGTPDAAAKKRDPMETKSYKEEVIKKNVAAGLVVQDRLPDLPAAKQRGVGTVLSTLHFLDYATHAERNHEFIAAKGPARLSADAVLALNMEWFDRNAQGLVMHKGWQYHHGEVAMVMRAVSHALGLGPREAMEGGRHRMELFLHDPDAPAGQQLKKQNLYDVVRTLGDYAEKCLDRPVPVPYREAYVAVARLLHYCDMLGDPGKLNKTVQRDPRTGKDRAADIIDWSHVDMAFQGFWHNDPSKKADLSATEAGAPETLRDRLRNKILDRAVTMFSPEDLEGLDEQYKKVWTEKIGELNLQGRAGVARQQTRHLKYGSTS